MWILPGFVFHCIKIVRGRACNGEGKIAFKKWCGCFKIGALEKYFIFNKEA